MVVAVIVAGSKPVRLLRKLIGYGQIKGLRLWVQVCRLRLMDEALPETNIIMGVIFEDTMSDDVKFVLFVTLK